MEKNVRDMCTSLNSTIEPCLKTIDMEFANLVKKDIANSQKRHWTPPPPPPPPPTSPIKGRIFLLRMDFANGWNRACRIGELRSTLYIHVLLNKLTIWGTFLWTFCTTRFCALVFFFVVLSFLSLFIVRTKYGSLVGGPQWRTSILRNGNVACLCRLFSPMSHVKFKKRLCHMSLYFLVPVAYA